MAEKLISLLTKPSKSKKHDDDFVDRLNNRYTIAILVTFAGVVGMYSYTGKPITCWCPKHFTGKQGNQFFFSLDTSFLYKMSGYFGDIRWCCGKVQLHWEAHSMLVSKAFHRYVLIPVYNIHLIISTNIFRSNCPWVSGFNANEISKYSKGKIIHM